MGLKKNPTEISALLKDKDEQISYLECQVQAYVARTSHIQSRLLSTLDTLDTLQTSHNLELASEIHAKERLSEKLDRYIDFVHAAEVEKDDLRDAVIQLVKKVELSNDYSLWPHSRIQSANPVEPVVNDSRFSESHRDYNDEYLTYSTAVIASLRAERDLERSAHEHTRQQAEHRIIELEARLARRDAELEACVTNTNDFLSQRTNHDYITHRLQDGEAGKQSQSDNRHLLREDAIQVMEMTSAKNKVLELEIRSLFKKLEKARQTASGAVPTASYREPDRSHDADQRSVQSLPPSPPDRLLSQSEMNHTTIRAADIKHQSIQALDHQIMVLASEVDAFQSERKLLADFVAKDQGRHTQTKIDGTGFERILLIEKECIRLADTERLLRVELQDVKNASITRETELQLEISRLRKLVEVPFPRNSLHDFRRDPNGEQSIEIATPFHTSTILANDGLLGPIESPYIDPPSIPLPPSPLSSERSSVSPIPPPPIIRRHSETSRQPLLCVVSKEAQIAQIEAELADARQDAEDKEAALSELRQVVENLRQQIAARDPNGANILFFDDALR